MICPDAPACQHCKHPGPHSPAGRSPGKLFQRKRCASCGGTFKVPALARLELRPGWLVVLSPDGGRVLAQVAL